MGSNLEAVLFDLDGVIVDTAKYHYLAWKKIADEQGIPFDEEINERLKGVSRMASLDIILEKASRAYSPGEKEALAARKNDFYVQLIGKLKPAEILPGVLKFLPALNRNGIKTAICSASKNTDLILERLKLKGYFDTVVSGKDVKKSKPDPEVFVAAARRLGVENARCVVIEDAFAGLEGAKRAGMKAIGLGDPKILTNADAVYRDISRFSLSDVRRLFLNGNGNGQEKGQEKEKRNGSASSRPRGGGATASTTKTADRYLEVDPWKIVENGFHPGRGRVSESLFSLANESMGVRGYFDEGFGGDRHQGAYINGVYEARKISPSYKGISTSGNYMVNTLDWLYTRVTAEGETLDLNRSRFDGFRRELDMREGTLAREFTWHLPSGGRVRLRFSRFVSMETPQLGGQRLEVEALDGDVDLQLRFGLDFDTFHEASDRKNFWDCPRKGLEGGMPCILGRTVNTGKMVFSGFALDAPAGTRKEYFEEEKLVGYRVALKAAPGKPLAFDKKVVNESGFDSGLPVDKAWRQGVEAADKVAGKPYDALQAAHSLYWGRLWETLDIRIEGDPENQQGIRYCVFQLHQTYHGNNPRANIGAKGLTGEFYNGHTFWDTEAYCLNFYLFNNPAAARNLLLYRYHHLPQAIQRARDIDCEGACFPFATINGEEDCGLWWIANTEIHVGLAVFYAIWHYERVTGDEDFLFKEGAELLVQLSRFYASRGQWSQKSRDFGLYGVMGPDEFKLMVNNNCYMNLLSKKLFQYAGEVAARMKRKAPAKWRALESKLGLKEAELKDWKAKAAKMRILQDRKTGVFEQNDGFFDMPHMDLKSIPVEQFPLYHSWSYDRLYRYDMHKQPDVLLFLFFFNREFSPRVKKANYDYYEPRCIHESSLSPAIHSILASEIGYHAQAYDLAQFASRLDLDNYNRNTREGLHTTSLAGAWMNLVYGFGGMRSDGETLSFEPSLPEKWDSLSYRVLYRGSVLQVKVDRREVSLALVKAAGRASVAARVFGRKVTVDAKGVKVKVPARPRR